MFLMQLHLTCNCILIALYAGTFNRKLQSFPKFAFVVHLLRERNSVSKSCPLEAHHSKPPFSEEKKEKKHSHRIVKTI